MGTHKKVFYFVGFLITSSLITVTYQNCSQMSAAGSASENSVLNGNPFAHNYGQNSVQTAAVYSDYDAKPVNPHASSVDDNSGAVNLSLPMGPGVVIDVIPPTVSDCTEPGRYEKERQWALDAAAGDPSGRTVPVKYSYSFGDKHDIIAKYANERAILSKANPGHSYIPVGPADKSRNFDANGRAYHYYYRANHDLAKDQYMSGDRCFFSTIQVDPGTGKEIANANRYDFIVDGDDSLKHKIHYMYYGWCKIGRCQADVGYAGEYANRLFSEVPSRLGNGSPQIIKLYVADFRSLHFGFNILQINSSLERGEELNAQSTQLMDLQLLHENLPEIQQNLSVPLVVDGIEFQPMVGINQTMNNLITLDVSGTVLALQYTPLVLDLGEKGIRTSSSRWGTFFNMAGLENLDVNSSDLNRWLVPHRTAWLGGVYTGFSPLNTGADAEPDIRVIAEDGFLVIPDADGKIRSSRNMFGDNMEIDGKFYENGFKALQALAKKYCAGQDIKDKYFGPWDGANFDRVKVWIDGDRNGVADTGEISSLSDQGVLAINTCNTVLKDAKDSFGNGTALRSAFLMKQNGESSVSEEEVLSRLKTGITSKGKSANFRLVIDVIFQTNEDVLLQDMNVGRTN